MSKKTVQIFIRNLVLFFVGFNILSLFVYQKSDLTLSTLSVSIVCALVTLPFESLKKELRKMVTKGKTNITYQL